MSPRMLWTSLLVALLTVVAALALVGRPATAAPQLAQTEIVVTPRKDFYAVGDVVSVTVQLGNLEDFYGADLGWTFDPEPSRSSMLTPTWPAFRSNPATCSPAAPSSSRILSTTRPVSSSSSGPVSTPSRPCMGAVHWLQSYFVPSARAAPRCLS